MKYTYTEMAKRLKDKEYEAVKEYPKKPVIPSILKDLDKKIKDGKVLELDVIKASEQYQKDLNKYEDDLLDYRREQANVSGQLRIDIMESCFSDEFLSKWAYLSNKLYSICYEKGHSYGYYEVFILLYNIASEIEEAIANDIKINKDYDLKD